MPFCLIVKKRKDLTSVRLFVYLHVRHSSYAEKISMPHSAENTGKKIPHKKCKNKIFETATHLL